MKLTDRERVVFVLRHADRLPFVGIAERLNVTRERARQIHAGACRNLALLVRDPAAELEVAREVQADRRAAAPGGEVAHLERLVAGYRRVLRRYESFMDATTRSPDDPTTPPPARRPPDRQMLYWSAWRGARLDAAYCPDVIRGGVANEDVENYARRAYANGYLDALGDRLITAADLAELAALAEEDAHEAAEARRRAAHLRREEAPWDVRRAPICAT